MKPIGAILIGREPNPGANRRPRKARGAGEQGGDACGKVEKSGGMAVVRGGPRGHAVGEAPGSGAWAAGRRARELSRTGGRQRGAVGRRILWW